MSPLYGYSLGAFSYLANNAADMYPHNMFLEIGVNTGLIGLALFVFGVVPIGLSAIKRAWLNYNDWQTAFIVAAMADIFIRMQVSLSVTQGKLLFLLLGVSVSLIQKDRAPSGYTYSNIKYPPAISSVTSD